MHDFSKGWAVVTLRTQHFAEKHSVCRNPALTVHVYASREIRPRKPGVVDKKAALILALDVLKAFAILPRMNMISICQIWSRSNTLLPLAF